MHKSLVFLPNLKNNSMISMSVSKSHQPELSSMSFLTTEQERGLLNKMREHSTHVPYVDNKMREAMQLIRIALSKQEILRKHLYT